MDYNGYDYPLATSATQLSNMSERFEEKQRIESEEKQLKELQDKENHDNLDSIAQYSYETVQNLKEIIKLLQEKNERLESQIETTNEILRLLFYVENQSCENQTEQLQQLYALEGQIAEALLRGERVNWKEKITDASIQTVIAAVGVVLKMRGLM
jgi:hypothetical protein